MANNQTVSLAELVSRGLHSIQETNQTPAPRDRTSIANKPSRVASPPRQALPPPLPPTMDTEMQRLLKSTENLVERLKWLPVSAADDAHAMRRHILHSVEYFLMEVSAKH